MSVPRRVSLTTRLTLLFAAVSSLVLLSLGLIIGELVERHFEDMDIDLLRGKLAQLEHVLAADYPSASLPDEALATLLIGQPALSLGLWDDTGQPVFISPEADFPAGLAQQIKPGQAAQASTWHGHDHQRYRLLLGQVSQGSKSPRLLRVALATRLAHHDHFMRDFRLTLWGIVGLAAGLCGLLGWMAARRGLAPLNAIAERAADITASRLNQRLETEAIPQELAKVAETLNAMLARLEESFRRLSDFSSDIAHELRTPVSNLLTQTQVTLSRARSLAEYQDALASNAEECERLTRMISDMLFLAKAENQLLIPHPQTVDLAVEAASLCEFYEAWAEEKAIRLVCEGSASCQGDRLMLRRAIGNLLSNALRHTPTGGEIRVRLQTADGHARLGVENTGPDIAPEHLPRLFDRFYRGDAARQHAGEGAGLGLAITRSIVLAHAGQVSVSSSQGLTLFSIDLPAA